MIETNNRAIMSCWDGNWVQINTCGTGLSEIISDQNSGIIYVGANLSSVYKRRCFEKCPSCSFFHKRRQTRVLQKAPKGFYKNILLMTSDSFVRKKGHYWLKIFRKCVYIAHKLLLRFFYDTFWSMTTISQRVLVLERSILDIGCWVN